MAIKVENIAFKRVTGDVPLMAGDKINITLQRDLLNIEHVMANNVISLDKGIHIDKLIDTLIEMREALNER